MAHSEISEQTIKQQVVFLSSKALKGRGTGTKGERLASQYISDAFAQLGLQPMGSNHTYIQQFPFVFGKKLGSHNSLSIKEGHSWNPVILGTDWLPLSFSNTTQFKAEEVVFAGYGISTPKFKNHVDYDSYRHINVKNKWVMVLRHRPSGLSKQMNEALRPYSSLRYKIFTAKEQGARGVIFINPGPLPSFNGHHSYNAGIPAFLISPTVLPKELHSMQVSGQIDLTDNIRYGHNVLGKMSLSNEPKGMIIIGAHLDHLGKQTKHSYYPGADDNASGVASILAIATQLKDLKIKGLLKGNKDILIAAWSGEELGLLGSSYYVKSLKTKEHVNSVINLDMVGHLKDTLVIQGKSSSRQWSNLIKQANTQLQLKLLIQNDPYLPTDSTSFYLAKIPILNFFTGAHPHYHSPEDKPETLNYMGIKTISLFIVELVKVLEDKSTISYQLIEDKKYQQTRHLNVYLGTIPNYSDTVHSGVAISGVKNFSPAQRAGLQANDIIIGLAHTKISNIYDYTFALNKLVIGRPVSISILRHQKITTLTVVPEYRQ